ncbi:Uncharacterised protein [Mycobacteroides abscessus subsp. abscessus]|nr:Uncharacterised protein [Mycobacteroides abscessus subsp. abscessus]
MTGTDLDKQRVRVLGTQRGQAARELHRLTQLPTPVLGFGSLRPGDPGTRHIRYEWDLRLL